MDELFEQIMAQTEAQFGPRDRTWQLGRIVVLGNDYPETTTIELLHVVVVRITESTRQFPMQAIYQLTHETVHCLSPHGRRDTLYFEEGLANHCALTQPLLPEPYLADCLADLPPILLGPLNAFRALNPTAQAVRALRAEQPNLDAVTPALVQGYFGVSHELAAAVCQRMPMGRPERM